MTTPPPVPWRPLKAPTNDTVDEPRRSGPPDVRYPSFAGSTRQRHLAANTADSSHEPAEGEVIRPPGSPPRVTTARPVEVLDAELDPDGTWTWTGGIGHVSWATTLEVSPELAALAELLKGDPDDDR